MKHVEQVAVIDPVQFPQGKMLREIDMERCLLRFTDDQGNRIDISLAPEGIEIRKVSAVVQNPLQIQPRAGNLIWVK